MSTRNIRKERIRRIIKEACGGDAGLEMHVEAPCPVKTAQKLRDSGHSADDVMSWVSELLSNFNSPMAQPVTTMVAVEQKSTRQQTIDTMTRPRNRGGIVGGIGFKK